MNNQQSAETDKYITADVIEKWEGEYIDLPSEDQRSFMKYVCQQAFELGAYCQREKGAQQQKSEGA